MEERVLYFVNAIVAAIVLAAVFAAAAVAQPASPPLRLVVGVAPGGSLDLIARLLGERLAETLKRPTLVENKPGANMLIATKQVGTSAADGNTVLVATVGPITTNPILYPNEPVDPLKGLTPVSLVAIGRLGLIVNAAQPVNSVAELLTLAKAKPGALNYGSGTTTFQIAMEMLMEQTGTQFARIPYNGTAPALNSLVAGQVELAVIDIGIALPHIRSGKLRALSVLSDERSKAVPQVPTSKESGLGGLEVDTWVAVFGPAGLAPTLVSQLNAAISQSVDNKQIQERLAAIDFEVVAYSPERTVERIRRDSALFKRVIEKTNMKLN